MLSLESILIQDFGPLRYDDSMEIVDHNEADEAYTIIAITGIGNVFALSALF